jgi:hypothetical protein
VDGTRRSYVFDGPRGPFHDLSLMGGEILVYASLKLTIGRELAASLSELPTNELASLVACQDDFGSNAGSSGRVTGVRPSRKNFKMAVPPHFEKPPEGG